MKHTIAFTRVNNFFRPTDIALVTFSTTKELPEGATPLTTLKWACQMWEENTSEGKEAYQESCEDFNIADLAQHADPNLLSEWGIHDLAIDIVDFDQQANFDTHLM